MPDKNNSNLLIDKEFQTHITTTEAETLKPIQTRFMESYIENREKMSVNEWLSMEIKANIPEISDSEVTEISQEIVDTLKMAEEMQASIQKAVENGRSKESWFASEAKKTTSYMGIQESSKYLQNLDEALYSANNALNSTIFTKAGSVSQNVNLDGFIAEQYHAQTFNLNAEATGSQYKAKVLQPDGNGYAKNSVDIVIVDGKGKVVKRYQSKYCKDADATIKALEKGDYRGQQALVPMEQSADIQKKNTTVLEAPDGTTSNPLTKEGAKDFQREAQSGEWDDLNWNDYRTKDLALGIGRQAGQSALMGATTGVGFYVVQKVWNGEEIDGAEVVETALLSGADFGVKAAAAGALKVGAEKGILTVIPKGTPAGTIANIVHVACENAKIFGKVATGELTVKEGLEKMEQTTVATVAGIATSAKGALIGAAIGTVLGPVGVAVGGFIGGTVGYMAGSSIGEKFVKGAQKIREKVHEAIKYGGNVVKSFCTSVKNGVKNFFV